MNTEIVDPDRHHLRKEYEDSQKMAETKKQRNFSIFIK